MRTVRRRRLERKTDYKSRLALIKSGKPRLVVRKTNRFVIAQLVQTDIAQDKVIVGVNSKELEGKGWPKSYSIKNKEAAYLTGFLLGVKAKGKVSGAIFDIGMHRNIAKSRIYSVLKGAIDSGLSIPHSKESLPSVDIKGEKIAKILHKIQGVK